MISNTTKIDNDTHPLLPENWSFLDITGLIKRIISIVEKFFTRSNHEDIFADLPGLINESEITEQSETKAKSLETRVITGIVNESRRDCFAISLLQMIANSDNLTNHISNAYPNLKPYIERVRKGKSVSSENFRVALNLETGKKGLNSQKDLSEYLTALLKKAPLYTSKSRDEIYRDTSPIFQIYPGKGTVSAQTKGVLYQEKFDFTTAPDTLILQANPTVEASTSTLSVDQVLNLDKHLCIDKSGGSYRLNFVALFHGKDNAGHYSSLVNTKDYGWMLLDDNKVVPLTDNQANKLVAKGSTFVYEKLATPIETETTKTELGNIAPTETNQPETKELAATTDEVSSTNGPNYYETAANYLYMAMPLIGIVSAVAFASIGV